MDDEEKHYDYSRLSDDPVVQRKMSDGYKKALAEGRVGERPSIMSHELAEEMMLRYEDGETWSAICEGVIAHGAALGWIRRNRSDLIDRYSRAKYHNAHTRANNLDVLIEDVRNGLIDPKRADTIVRIHHILLKAANPDYSDKQQITHKQEKPEITLVRVPKERPEAIEDKRTDDDDGSERTDDD